MKPADNAFDGLNDLERGVQDFRPDSIARVKCDSIGVQILVPAYSLEFSNRQYSAGQYIAGPADV